MNLYYAATYYQLLCVIVYNNLFHKDEKSILIIDKFMETKMDKLRATNMFSEIYSISYIAITDESTKSRMEICDKFNQIIPYDINSFNNIYIAGAHNAISLFLIEKNMHFSIFEECSGIMSNIDKLRENVCLSSPVQDKVMEAYGMYDGSNILVDKIYCDIKNQKTDFCNKKAVNFSLIDSLQRVSRKDLDKIISVFIEHFDYNIDLESNACILLTQHFANLKILTWDEQIEIYQLVCDYFLKQYNKIIIKPHPADNMFYDQFLMNSYTIYDTFPSELIPFMFKHRPDGLATVSSTAVNSLIPYFKKILMFDFYFEKQYKLLHHYFIALEIALSYLSEGYNLYFYNTNKKIVENILYILECKNDFFFIEKIEDLKIIPHKAIVIVDDFNLNCEYSFVFCEIINSLPDDVTCIFLNSELHYMFYDVSYKSIWNHMSVVDINVKSTDDFNYLKQIFIFNKGVNHVMYYSNKQLTNSKLSVSAEEFEGDALRIKILEGMLRATEERLKYYIEKVEQMEGKK